LRLSALCRYKSDGFRGVGILDLIRMKAYRETY